MGCGARHWKELTQLGTTEEDVLRVAMSYGGDSYQQVRAPARLHAWQAHRISPLQDSEALWTGTRLCKGIPLKAEVVR